MAVVVLCQSPAYVPGFMPFEGHILNYVFGSAPSPVSVQIWPIAPATAVTGAAVFINGSGVKPSTLTAIPGTQGKTLTFNLGGDPDEFPGQVNTVFIDIDDNRPDYTSVAMRYYRAAGAVPTTTTTTTAPPATTPPATTTTTTRPPTTGPVTTPMPGKRPPYGDRDRKRGKKGRKK
jgi:hypothetical protein